MGAAVFWVGFSTNKLSSSLSAQTHPPNPVSSLKNSLFSPSKDHIFCTDELLCSRTHTGQRLTGRRMEINPTASTPPSKITFITAWASLFYWLWILQGCHTRCLSFCEVSTPFPDQTHPWVPQSLIKSVAWMTPTLSYYLFSQCIKKKPEVISRASNTLYARNKTPAIVIIAFESMN